MVRWLFCNLANKGLRARKGQIVDASFVEAPRQPNTHEQNQTIKDRLIPAEFLDNAHVASQKDIDARWTQKNDENYFGCKNHICVDVEHKLIRNFACTNAAVHDFNQFETLLAPTKIALTNFGYKSCIFVTCTGKCDLKNESRGRSPS